MKIMTLSIAGLQLGLQVENENFYNRLIQRFDRFINPDQNPNAWIGLHLTSNQPRVPWSEPLLSWEKDGCELTAPGMNGRIDSESRQAAFQISPAQSLQEVEHLIRICTAIWIFQMGGLLVHGAGLVYSGNGYLFVGVSGAGKTTASRLSKQAYVLNDDLVVLMPEDDVWQVWATPFSNPSQVKPNPGHALLKVMCKLIQDKAHDLVPITQALAAAEIISHVVVINSYPAHTSSVFQRCLKIVKLLQNYELHFLPDDGFWELLA